MTVSAITSARRPVKDVRQKALVAELRARIAELEAQLAGVPARKPAARKTSSAKTVDGRVERRKAESMKAFLKIRFPNRDCSPTACAMADRYEISQGMSPAVVAQFRYTGGRKEDKATLALVLNAARWTSETVEEAA